jgi:hypothetical protein
MADLGPRAAHHLHQVGEVHDAGARLVHQICAQFAGPRHRGRQADAHVTRRNGLQAGEIERQQIAALGRAQCMQLIEDDGIEPGQEARRVGVR